MVLVSEKTLTKTRREFLQATPAALAAGVAAPYYATTTLLANESGQGLKNDRPRVGCIGLRYQGSVIAERARVYGDIVALADVDRNVLHQGRASFGSTPKIFEDYRDMLVREDIDIITIGTPDHWHTKMVIDACRAGKDVYVEKPLTLTIEEGKQIRRVVEETGRVVQVGSWQRSDARLRKAVEMVRQGRLGKLERVEVVLGKNKTGGPFLLDDPPPELNWNLWQGQTPLVPYQHERCHYTFRWWLEYSGGQLTDWGAHHIDIAQWAINAYPSEVQGEAKYPNVERGYNVPIDFSVKVRYPNDVEMTISDTGRSGILFTGSEGRIFVNRGTLAGKPVDALKENPLSREAFTLYDFDNLERPERVGKIDAIKNHMGNFFDCVRARRQPISDVESQHRTATTCHLANIALRVGRPIRWDAKQEQIVDDSEANAMLRREQRQGFETV